MCAYLFRPSGRVQKHARDGIGQGRTTNCPHGITLENPASSTTPSKTTTTTPATTTAAASTDSVSRYTLVANCIGP